MGQYYSIVNIDKGEFINPNEFGDGVKLLEFGSEGCGTMTGLSILLASGNGRGGGDLYRNTCLGEDIDLRKNLHLEMLGEFSDGKGGKCRIIAPKIAGSWAGDRIVVAGDYADPGVHVPVDRPLSEKERDAINNRYVDWKAKEIKTTKDMTLQDFADINFKDISKDVVKAMRFDSFLDGCLGKT